MHIPINIFIKYDDNDNDKTFFDLNFTVSSQTLTLRNNDNSD